LIDLRPNNY